MRLRTIALAVLFTAASPPAWAQLRDPAAAEQLFQAGLKALEADDWETACPKFDASMQLDPSVGTLLNIAKCHEHRGQLTAAMEDYRQALALNRDVDSASRRDEVASYTQGRLDALAPRIAKVTVRVTPTPPDLMVTRDGIQLPVAALGEPLPVDPGDHVIAVSAPGYHDARKSVTLGEGQADEVTFELRAQEAAPPVSAAGAPAPSPAPDPGPADQSPPDQGDRAESSGGLAPLGWGLLGGGAIGLGVGAVTGIMTISKKSEVEVLCPEPAQCTDEGVDAASSGQTLSTVSTVAFVVGAALAAAGVVVLLVGSGEDAAALTPAVGPHTAGLQLVTPFD